MASLNTTAVAPLLPGMLGAYCCLRAARRSADAAKVAWAFLAAGAALIALSRFILLQAAWPGETQPAPALPESLQCFIFAGFYLMALLKPHRDPARAVRPAVTLDALLAALLLLVLHFHFSAVHRFSGGARDYRFAGVLFVLVLGLGAALWLMGCRRQAQAGAWKRAYTLTAAAALCHAASQAAGIAFHTAIADVLESAALALMALAPSRGAVVASTPPPTFERPARHPVVSVWRELAVPALVLLGLLGISLLDRIIKVAAQMRAAHPSLWHTTMLAVMVIYVVLVLARQFLMQMENRSLALDLQQESMRLRLLLSNIHDAVVTEDLDGRIMFANDRFFDLFGLDRTPHRHLRLEDCVHPEDRRLRRDLRGLPGADASGALRFEFRGVRGDGVVLYLESSMAPVQPGGMILGYQSVIRDITQRRQAEEKQRELAQRLEFLVSHMPLGFIVFGLDFRILEWNNSAASIFGWAATEVFGRNGLELLAPPEHRPSRSAAWGELVQSKSSGHCMSQNLTKDRGLIECEWFNTSLIDETGRVVAVASVVQDVTERKNLEAQLRQSQKMEAVGVLAGGIAHDFNNLLTVIMGNVSLALTRLDISHPAVRGLYDAEKAAERATHLVQQLLGFSRKSRSVPRPLNLNVCVKETVELLSRTVDPRIVIETREQPDLWLVEADPGQIYQILMNLCVNARDAMENGGRLHMATANRTLHASHCREWPEARPGEFVECSVSDTGSGMDRATLARIFEPFFTTKEVGKGTGLGLSVAYGIVKQHEGWITVESQPGRGSTFSVFLPRSATVPQREISPRVESAAAGSETILIVDDEDMVRSLGRGILESNGHRVVEARDGEEALRIVRELGGIDLVLLDMTMPRRSGRDTLLELQRLAPHVPVVLSSGYACVGPSDLAAMGARAFIQKPYRPEEMTRTVRTVLDARFVTKAD